VSTQGKTSAEERLQQAIADYGLTGRTLYLPQMPYGGSLLLAAAIRSIGMEARVTPDSDERTIVLGGKVTSGDECYPQKITVGDFLAILEDKERSEVAFLMPTANGPCRFGQYMHLIRRTLDELGYDDVPVITITSNDGYSSIGQYSRDLIRTAWQAVVSQDILMKMLLKTRPYEVEKGVTDAAYHASLADVEAALETRGIPHKERLRLINEALARTRERFAALPVRYDSSRPLVGVVGEIFCRLNTFANADVIRLLEEQGAECWLSDVSEWVWYVDDEHKRRLVLQHRVLSKESLGRWIRASVQRSDEHALLDPFAEEFVGYEEAHNVREILELSHPYLPYTGALGEMVLSTGKCVYLYRKGADGIIDISPFTCMNGIVTEAIYPVVQRDCDGIPIRTFYFDGTQSNLERDIGIFIELAKTYQRRKKTERRFPAAFLASAGEEKVAV
jgi:predicted nucleotide-binding protein (sugar kinase/HSP70/actin superfamily)